MKNKISLTFQIIKYIVFLIALTIIMTIGWFGLTVLMPDFRFIIIPFGIIMFIIKTPKEFFIFFYKHLKQFFFYIKDQFTDDEADPELETDLPIEDIDDEPDHSDLIFKGLIGLSAIFLFLICYFHFENKNIEQQVALMQISLPVEFETDIKKDPIQILYKGNDNLIKNVKGVDYNIKKLAKYRICGIVVVKNTFLMFDPGKHISPVDIGLVWGDLAKPENYRKMHFFSNFRLMTCKNLNKVDITEDYYVKHNSHNHIIPANDLVKNVVMNLKYDDKVVFEGYLVEVTSNVFGKPWRSSLRRDDHLFNSGAGCEIFYVEKVSVL